jgi:hypothetical protein
VSLNEHYFLNLPTMKNSIIVAATPNLSKSLDFYDSLDFAHYEDHGTHYVVDGNFIIEVTDQKSIRSGVKLYKTDWSQEVELLKALTPVAEMEDSYVVMDSTGIWIQLVNGSNDLPVDVEFEKASKLGTIAGLSLEGISIPAMNKTWKILGFEKTMGDENGGWMATMNKDGLAISLMKINACPHSFYNPSLTYFNGKKNLDIIANIKAAGIPITEEITIFNDEGIVDNVIIRDPGGFGFFIFSD